MLLYTSNQLFQNRLVILGSIPAGEPEIRIFFPVDLVGIVPVGLGKRRGDLVAGISTLLSCSLCVHRHQSQKKNRQQKNACKKLLCLLHNFTPLHMKNSAAVQNHLQNAAHFVSVAYLPSSEQLQISLFL